MPDECTHNELIAKVTTLEVSLEAFKELMGERDKRYEQRAKAQDDAVAAALAAANEATKVAKAEVDAHLKALNEIRTMSLDQAKTFAVAKVMDEKFEGTKNEIKGIREAALLQAGARGGMREMVGWFIAVASIAGAVIVEIIRH